MADNDLEIEGLIDSIRGHEPSQEEVLEPAEFISVEEVMAGPSAVAPSPLLFGHAGPGYAYPDDVPMLVSGLIDNWSAGQSNNNLTIQDNNGPSVTFTSDGVITLHSGPNGPDCVINLRQQALTIAHLQQRLGSLEQIVNLLGTALNAQIDNETMSGLAPHEREEIRRVVAERNTNQRLRAEIRELMKQQDLPTIRALK